MLKKPPAGYPRISPYLNYEDTGSMMVWLERVFGLQPRHRQTDCDGRVLHAEMTIDDGVVMMGSPGGSFQNPRHLGHSTQSLYVYIDNVDMHCEQAKSAGAKIIEEPNTQPYGDRRYGVSDPEGHIWYFAARFES